MGNSRRLIQLLVIFLEIEKSNPNIVTIALVDFHFGKGSANGKVGLSKETNRVFYEVVVDVRNSFWSFQFLSELSPTHTHSHTHNSYGFISLSLSVQIELSPSVCSKKEVKLPFGCSPLSATQVSGNLKKRSVCVIFFGCRSIAMSGVEEADEWDVGPSQVINSVRRINIHMNISVSTCVCVKSTRLGVNRRKTKKKNWKSMIITIKTKQITLGGDKKKQVR